MLYHEFMIRDNQTTYGHDVEDWEATKQECKHILRTVARKQTTIAYSDLTARLKPIRFDPHETPFFHFLGEISTEEDEEERGMMTSIVVHKTGDNMPGPGCDKLAHRLGRNTSDIYVTWVREVQKVHEVWSR